MDDDAAAAPTIAAAPAGAPPESETDPPPTRRRRRRRRNKPRPTPVDPTTTPDVLQRSRRFSHPDIHGDGLDAWVSPMRSGLEAMGPKGAEVGAGSNGTNGGTRGGGGGRRVSKDDAKTGLGGDDGINGGGGETSAYTRWALVEGGSVGIVTMSDLKRRNCLSTELVCGVLDGTCAGAQKTRPALSTSVLASILCLFVTILIRVYSATVFTHPRFS